MNASRTMKRHRIIILPLLAALFLLLQAAPAAIGQGSTTAQIDGCGSTELPYATFSWEDENDQRSTSVSGYTTDDPDITRVCVEVTSSAENITRVGITNRTVQSVLLDPRFPAATDLASATPEATFEPSQPAPGSPKTVAVATWATAQNSVTVLFDATFDDSQRLQPRRIEVFNGNDMPSDAFRVLAVPTAPEEVLDLTLSMSINPANLMPGDTFSVTHRLENTGDLPTSGILRWNSPAELDLIQVPQGCLTDSAEPGRITCALSGLEPGENREWTVELRVPAELPNTQTMTEADLAQVYAFLVPGSVYTDGTTGSTFAAYDGMITVEVGPGISLNRLYLPLIR